MIVLVCGGRDYNEWKKVHALLDALHKAYGITKIVQGCAQGADYCAWTWANLNGVPTTGDEYKPDWDNEGRSAGIKRNERMFHEEEPHLVIGFPGDRGTAHMTEFAAARRCPTMIVPDPEWTQSRVLADADDLIDLDAEDGAPWDEEVPSKPFWLHEPGKNDRWPRRVVKVPTPPDRYEPMF